MKHGKRGQGSKPETARRGPEAFESSYEHYFGDRWPDLRAALLAPAASIPLHTASDRPYYLDEASYQVALALASVPGERILDMCAAPGGKTLVLALCSVGWSRLVANERSSARRARLHRVLDEHLSDSVRGRVEVTAHDATRWGLYERDVYDKVLVDVPCSSERHVINDDAALADWSISRSRRLASAAVGFLAAAVDAAGRGGVICYCTCALTSAENDDVVAKVLRRRNGIRPMTGRRGTSTRIPRADRSAEAESTPPPGASLVGSPSPVFAVLAGGEQTEYGALMLPDSKKGAGPLYSAFIKKA